MTATGITINNVTATCPDCGRRLAAAPLFQVATNVVRRTCRGCRATWSIKMTPAQLPGLGVATTCEFTRVIDNCRQYGSDYSNA